MGRTIHSGEPANELREGNGRGPTLLQSTSIVFALIAVLPLLTFTYVLYSLRAADELQYQVGLGLAVAVALGGFYIFRLMMARVSGLITALSVAVEKRDASAVRQQPLHVTGIGRIREIDQLAGTLDEHLANLWRTEAERHLGRPVIVSLRDSPRVVSGLLVEVDDAGILLEEDHVPVGVAYRRIAGLEPAPTAADPAIFTPIHAMVDES